MLTVIFQTDLRQLAVGVLYLNLGRAVVDFPTTSTAHPSYSVVLSLAPSGPLLVNHRGLFPMQVNWDIWRNIIAPLFDDASVLVKVLGGTNETLRQQINRVMLLDDNVETLIVKIEQAILQGYEAQGYLPAGGVSPVEPLVVSPSSNVLYTRFDT